MAVLHFQFYAPMQSWGTDSRGEIRGTALWPTKSGIVGLLANTLGRDRHDPIDDLANLKFGVRADRPGAVMVDFHTTGAGTFPITFMEAAMSRVLKPSSSGHRFEGSTIRASYNAGGSTPPLELANGDVYWPRSLKPSAAMLSERAYLADAAFTVAVEERDGTTSVGELAEALKAPARQPYLGRRSCPPGGPMEPAIDGRPLREVLSTVPRHPNAQTGPLRALIEDIPNTGEPWRTAQPTTFRPWMRNYRTVHMAEILVNPEPR